MLCHPYPQEAEVGDDAICMCETIVQIFIKKKKLQKCEIVQQKSFVALLLDLLHQLCFYTPCSNCWLIVDLNQVLLIHRTEGVSWTQLQCRSGEERLDACHHYSCRGQTTPETPLVLGENNANLIIASLITPSNQTPGSAQSLLLIVMTTKTFCLLFSMWLSRTRRFNWCDSGDKSGSLFLFGCFSALND